MSDSKQGWRPGMTAEQLTQAYRAGELDPVTVTEAVLAHSADRSLTHVFITLTPERARAEAQASRERYRAGKPLSALDGVPMVWKDLFDLKGERTTCASAVRAEAGPATDDAELVAALSKAGVISIGKTNLSEFAFSGLGINNHSGTPINPHDREQPRIPGGSSSGSAVAVAVGLVPLAMGSDTSGSIRVPASFNGVVGFKPSFGRYGLGGTFPLAPSLDVAGPLAESMQDVITMDRILQPDSTLSAAPDPALTTRIKLVVPDGILTEKLEPDVQAAFAVVVQALDAAGFAIERRRFEAIEATYALFSEQGTLVGVEAAQVHTELLDSDARNLLDRRILSRLVAGSKLPAQVGPLLHEKRREYIEAMRASLHADELLLFPSTRSKAPLLQPLQADDALFAKVNLSVLRNTMIGSFLDWPTVSLPIPQCGDALPIGLSIAGLPQADEQVLAVSTLIERVLQG